jgi:ATP-binding cassette subfamily B multidrug efflux pump
MARTAQVEQEFLKNPLWFYIKANRRAFSIGMIFLVATNTIDGLYPLVLKRGIDQITARCRSFLKPRHCFLR